MNDTCSAPAAFFQARQPTTYTAAPSTLPPAGEGDDETILAAARDLHAQREQRMQEREQRMQEQAARQQAMLERNARVVQLLRENNMPSFYAFSVASIAHYIETGVGVRQLGCRATCWVCGG